MIKIYSIGEETPRGALLWRVFTTCIDEIQERVYQRMEAGPFATRAEAQTWIDAHKEPSP